MPTSDPAGTPIIPAYGRDAARYDARTGRYEIYRRRVIDLLPLSDGDVVLDVGCGTGLAFERLLGRVGPAGTVVGGEPAAAMRLLAAQRVAPHGWTNVTLVGSPVESAVLPTVDHALFCAVHDVLQSAPAIDNVLGHVRDGGGVAAGGGEGAPPWALAVNAAVLALHAPFVRDFAGSTGRGRCWRSASPGSPCTRWRSAVGISPGAACTTTSPDVHRHAATDGPLEVGEFLTAGWPRSADRILGADLRLVCRGRRRELPRQAARGHDEGTAYLLEAAGPLRCGDLERGDQRATGAEHGDGDLASPVEPVPVDGDPGEPSGRQETTQALRAHRDASGGPAGRDALLHDLRGAEGQQDAAEGAGVRRGRDLGEAVRHGPAGVRLDHGEPPAVQYSGAHGGAGDRREIGHHLERALEQRRRRGEGQPTDHPQGQPDAVTAGLGPLEAPARHEFPDEPVSGGDGQPRHAGQLGERVGPAAAEGHEDRSHSAGH